MKTPLIILVGAALAMLGGLYFQFYWPPNAAKREVEKALQQFAAAVETQDRAQVSAALNALIADGATIRLNVEILAVTQQTGQKPVMQDFDKAEFIRFIDNILYTVTDSHYYPKLKTLEYRDDGRPMPVAFTSNERGEGSSYYAGVPVAMRFTTDTACTGQVIFTGDAPQLSQASCDVGLRMLPKAGSNQTLFDNNGVREMLERGEQR